MNAPPLGTTTESTSALSRTAFLEGVEIDGLTAEVLDGSTTRLNRWDRLATAQRLLSGHRIGVCNRVARVDGSMIGVRRRRDGSGAYYTGLMQCANVWACPVCSAKISERRRVELTGALAAAKLRGWRPLLLTLTVRHDQGQELPEVLRGLLSAYNRLVSGVNRLSALDGYCGAVRSLEVTHGANGWHPHLHVLIFVTAATVSAWQLRAAALLDRWSRITGAVGLGKCNRHGLQLHDGAKAARYVSKWGLPEELTKTAQKSARSETSRTPFQLLDDARGGDWLSGELYRHYVDSMAGRAQLYWSAGLRKSLALEVKTDEELVQHEDQGDEGVLSLTKQEFAHVVRLGLRGALLEMARSADVWQLEEFVIQLRSPMVC